MRGWYDVGVLRRLFTIMSMLSLLFCTAAIVLWVRSYESGESWAFAPREIHVPPGVRGYFAGPEFEWFRYWWVTSSKGRIQFVQKEIPDSTRRRRTPERVGYLQKTQAIQLDATVPLLA